MRFNHFIALALVFFTTTHSLAVTTPNVSANSLFLYRQSNNRTGDVNVTDPEQQPNGLDIQEIEIQFFSEVDPYTKLGVFLAMGPSYETDGTEVSQEWSIEPEEVYAESNIVPQTTLKIGKFLAYMGRHNLLHTHAFPFVDAPLANSVLLGDEGFNDTGISAAYLLPTSWFNEITVQYMRGKGENEQFNSASPADGVILGHWKNLVDLSDSLTAELGLSFAQGNNSLGSQTELAGADLTFKWRPTVGGKYSSIQWSTEYLQRIQKQEMGDQEKGYGLASWIQYQLTERWSALYRHDNLEIENSLDTAELSNGLTERNSVAFVFAPTEFSSFKLEYNQSRGRLLSGQSNETERTLLFQANFTIGAHPSHFY